jgi:hypothetical protein
MPAPFVACSPGFVNESVVIRENGALRLTVEHGSSKKEAACEEVDTYKMKDATSGASVGEIGWTANMIPHQNHTTIKLTRRCETLNAIILLDSIRPSVVFESVSTGDSGLFEAGLAGALYRSPGPLPSLTMRKGDGRRSRCGALAHG